MLNPAAPAPTAPTAPAEPPAGMVGIERTSASPPIPPVDNADVGMEDLTAISDNAKGKRKEEPQDVDDLMQDTDLLRLQKEAELLELEEDPLADADADALGLDDAEGDVQDLDDGEDEMPTEEATVTASLASVRFFLTAQMGR